MVVSHCFMHCLYFGAEAEAGRQPLGLLLLYLLIARHRALRIFYVQFS